MSNTTATPIYFEESWAILSSIDLVNVLLGLMVIGITSLSPLVSVPIITSIAGCIANGLCYYSFYAHYPHMGTVVAAAVADVTWLIQEAGMSFYSYLILIRVLGKKSRLVFVCLFWMMMVILIVIRTFILIKRAQDIVEGGTSRQNLINHLHNGYFSCIAIVECISAYFLLSKFSLAKRDSSEAASTSGLFHYLMRSTEVRLAILALIGVSRAITYSFQTSAQMATNIAGQVDRFVYTLECLFPIMMFIDILASRLAVSNNINESLSTRSRAIKSGSAGTRRNRNMNGEIGMYPMSPIETRVDANGQVSSSQERIVDGASSGARSMHHESDMDGINKKVEFEFYESAA